MPTYVNCSGALNSDMITIDNFIRAVNRYAGVVMCKLLCESETGVWCCVQGMSKEWNSLTALVTHHTVMRELLPCVLVLPDNTGRSALTTQC